MRYRQSIVINKPRAKVIELFRDQNKLKQWQAGLQKVTPISGETGEEGSKTKLNYERNDQNLEMIQTITKINIPEEFHATYETNGLVNNQENYFNPVGENFTEWQSISTFKFKGVKKVIFNLMKSAFKEQSLKYMIAFKKYVESV